MKVQSCIAGIKPIQMQMPCIFINRTKRQINLLLKFVIIWAEISRKLFILNNYRLYFKIYMKGELFHVNTEL